jgi:hypothetical protein
MDINNCIFSGIIEWSKERRVGTYNFGNINVRIGLPKFEFNWQDQVKIIDSPNIWCNIKVSYDNNGLLERHQEILNTCATGPYCIVSGGKITDYEVKVKDADGNIVEGAPMERRYNLDIGARDISFSRQPIEDINQCIFTGYVEDYKSNGSMIVKSSYRAKDQMKYRKIPVIWNGPFDNTLNSSRILVLGSICGKTPTRESKLYVVANNIIRIP